MQTISYYNTAKLFCCSTLFRLLDVFDTPITVLPLHSLLYLVASRRQRHENNQNRYYDVTNVIYTVVVCLTKIERHITFMTS